MSAVSENAGPMPAVPVALAPTRIGTALMRPLEVVAAGLLVLIVGLLLLGVISRYAFSLPIIWVDEVASFAFLWLAMLG